MSPKYVFKVLHGIPIRPAASFPVIPMNLWVFSSKDFSHDFLQDSTNLTTSPISFPFFLFFIPFCAVSIASISFERSIEGRTDLTFCLLVLFSISFKISSFLLCFSTNFVSTFNCSLQCFWKSNPNRFASLKLISCFKSLAIIIPCESEIFPKSFIWYSDYSCCFFTRYSFWLAGFFVHIPIANFSPAFN